MARLSWHAVEDRRFETGLDRGVLYPKDAPAVAWNGLTGVDEEGAEEAVSFYIDGRPFLYFPKPKEFEATLRAYTFPEEFSRFMGVVEAADGLYLDSQLSDVFDLSYRTLVGNAAEGIDFGYKIHLVYNATATPEARTYDSLGSEINPTELSWKINAVPMRVEGYRSTAHIIIDTRHLDEERLAEIEALLYGDDETDAHMPDPQDIYDLLSFGDMILVKVHDDGTWTAEGSYTNIYMVSPGVFEIKDVNAVDNEDGTFTISTGGNTIVEEA